MRRSLHVCMIFKERDLSLQLTYRGFFLAQAIAACQLRHMIDLHPSRCRSDCPPGFRQFSPLFQAHTIQHGNVHIAQNRRINCLLLNSLREKVSREGPR